MEEIWKDIEGLENKYQASSLGRIRSVVHYTNSKKYGGKILNQISSEQGKLRVHLYNRKARYYMVHILVAKAFPEICGKWFEGCQVHHIDCNPSNNSPYNLICLTTEEHNRIHKEMGQKVGEKNPFYGKHHTNETIVKLSRQRRKPVIQMDLEGNEIFGWFSAKGCQAETGMFATAISACCRGRAKSAYGFRWRYAS